MAKTVRVEPLQNIVEHFWVSRTISIIIFSPISQHGHYFNPG